MAKYDYFSGGLDELLIDIETLKMDIKAINIDMVKELAIETDLSIKRKASAEIQLDVSEIIASNRIDFPKIRADGMVSLMVVNSSEAATYAEFGYGIVGKYSPHIEPDFFGSGISELSGGWVYDYKNRGSTKWGYTDKAGFKHTTRGIEPRYMFYDSYREVYLRINSIGLSRFSQLKLGGKGQ